eukprot:489317-Hanusia_phi.AAC.2
MASDVSPGGEPEGLEEPPPGEGEGGRGVAEDKSLPAQLRGVDGPPQTHIPPALETRVIASSMRAEKAAGGLIRRDAGVADAADGS